MLSLAICDDQEMELINARSFVTAFFSTSYPSEMFKISTFQSGSSLFSTTQRGRFFDIYIIDIELNDIHDGIFYANEIHKRSPNSQIIFLSAHPQYAIPGYRTGAVRFINKKMLKEHLSEALSYAVKQHREANQKFVLITNNYDSQRVLLSDIQYVQKEKHSVCVHIKSGDEIKKACTLSSFFALLNDSRFIYIDKSLIINMDYAKKTSESNVYLAGVDQPLQISRRSLSKVKDAIRHHLME